MDLNTDPFRRQMILLAHGSRDTNWCSTFENGLAVINRQLEVKACLAYMEMAAPGLDTVISKYYLNGVRHFDILPLFFAEGRHLLHDVPGQIEMLQSRFPGIEIRLDEAVGRQEKFWEALGILISTEYANGRAKASIS